MHVGFFLLKTPSYTRLTSSSCSSNASTPILAKICDSHPNKNHQQCSKNSAPSPRPAHPHHTIEEQTSNELNCKTTKPNQKEKQEVELSTSIIPHDA
jgi:hypothetical protein